MRMEKMNTANTALLLVVALSGLPYIPSDMQPDIDSRVIGGSPMSISEVPWQVSVRLVAVEARMFGAGFICGGSAISERIVITAAHCVHNYHAKPPKQRAASDLTVVMGTALLFNVSEDTLQYAVEDVRRHEHFNPITYEYDIALFFLNGSIPRGHPTVTFIPLQTGESPPAGTMCTVSGWGKSRTADLSQVLLGAKVPIVSNVECSENYGNISDGMMCAGLMVTGGVDACRGDSGGPLACGGHLVGIVSWGKSCALPGYPGVYTDVVYYGDWISKANSTFGYAPRINDKGGRTDITDAACSRMVNMIVLWASIIADCLL